MTCARLNCETDAVRNSIARQIASSCSSSGRISYAADLKSFFEIFILPSGLFPYVLRGLRQSWPIRFNGDESIAKSRDAAIKAVALSIPPHCVALTIRRGGVTVWGSNSQCRTEENCEQLLLHSNGG